MWGSFIPENYLVPASAHKFIIKRLNLCLGIIVSKIFSRLKCSTDSAEIWCGDSLGHVVIASSFKARHWNV